MSEKVTAVQGQFSCTSSGIITAGSMLKWKWKLEEKSVEVVGHLNTSGVNFKTKPFLKEKRLLFPLNDTQLFLPLSAFFPSLLRMMLQLLWTIDSMNNSICSSVQKHPKALKKQLGEWLLRQANCRNNCLLLSRGRQTTEGMLGEHLLHLFQKGACLL